MMKNGEKLMEHPDLFGGLTPMVEAERVVTIDTVRKRMGYRRAEGEQRCKNCRHLRRRKYDRNYYKCKHIGMSHSPATDVRLRDVCDLHERMEDMLQVKKYSGPVKVQRLGVLYEELPERFLGTTAVEIAMRTLHVCRDGAYKHLAGLVQIRWLRRWRNPENRREWLYVKTREV